MTPGRSDQPLAQAPLDRANSYTVFLLPFAYSTEVLKSQGSAADAIWTELSWAGPLGGIGAQDREEVPSPDSEVQRRPGASAGDASPERLQPEEADPLGLAWRLQYFMPETNLVLFKRARWFQLAGIKKIFANDLSLVRHDGSTIALGIEWSRLVLFEWDLHADKCSQGASPFAKNGLLLIKVGFSEATTPTTSDLLRLNEIFRYYKLPFYKHPDVAFKRHEEIIGLPGPTEDEHLCMSYWAMWESLLCCPARLMDGTSFRLFPQEWLEGARSAAMATAEGQAISTAEELLNSAVSGASPKGYAVPTWDVYPDNRAFVWTCARLSQAEGHCARFEGLLEQATARTTCTDPLTEIWHALLDVDSAPVPVDGFRLNWVQERSFMRWASGSTPTVYGFNNFSVAVMGCLESWVPAHFERMYLDMGLLLLYVRTCLFRASQRISWDTQARLAAGVGTAWEEHFRAFRGEFAAFVNLYQFPLLSTQQQAIEIYEKLRHWMDIDQIFAEVKAEIESTHELAELIAEKNAQTGADATQNAINTLTVFGLGIAIAALLAQILGSNDMFGTFMGHGGHLALQLILPLLLGVGVTSVLAGRFFAAAAARKKQGG